MRNPTQKQLILQETFECCHLAMEDFLGHASDLESVGFNRDGEDLRHLTGEIENLLHRMRERHQ